VRVAFLVNDLELSGGIGVVVQHARQLARGHGFDVTLVMVREQDGPTWTYESLAEVPVRSLASAREDHYDIAVATWWETTFSLFELSADRYAYFIQSMEDRFYRPDQAERYGAAMTLGLPVAFLTEARWIADTIRELRPQASCHLVRNGIDKRVFASPEDLDVRLDGPLRILIEGNPLSWFKHLDSALFAASAMREPHHVTLVTGQRGEAREDLADQVLGPLTHEQMAGVYGESDVVLKLSSVEGMFGPPLEGFHMGATCVTTPVTGHEEYIEHGFNAMLCDWDDLPGTSRQLDLLARDRRLLHQLRTNALHTAQAWPSWEQSSQFMAAALHDIARSPAPDPAEGAPLLMSQLRGTIEAHRGHLRERNVLYRELGPLRRLRAQPAVARLERARHRRSIRLGLRLVRPLLKRLSGRPKG
jgi:O-antigen biosynthesis protein